MTTKTFVDGTTATVHEENDRRCTDPQGHDFNPDNGAPFGANGNCCRHCGHFVGLEYHHAR